MKHRTRTTRLTGGALALALGLALAATACADDGGETQADTTVAVETTASDTTAAAAAAETTAAATADFPVTIEAANGPVTIGARPERIVSLSPAATEMLFAIGAGDQVVAVDALSNFPEGAPVTDLSGFEPNVEAIAAEAPDLVVLSDDIGNVVAGLGALSIAVVQTPAAITIDDTYAQIEQLGAATGHAGDAAAVVAQMKADIEEIVTSVAAADGTTYYHELDSTLFSVTSATFIGEVYGAFGLVNIADDADPDGFGYPQLSAEHVLEQDPALIFLADTKCCGETAATVAERPGWSGLAAIRNGTVIELDDDIASRWGPRVVDFHRAIADAIAKLPVG